MANAINDVFRIVAQFDPAQAASEVQNIYYARLDALVSADDADILGDFAARIDLIMTQVADIFADAYEGVSVNVTNVTKRERVGQQALTFVGTAVTDELPAQTAAEVLMPLKAQGRTGRKYLGPVVEGAQVATALTAAAITALNAAAALIADADWVGGVSGNTYAFGLARFNGKILQDFTPFIDGGARVEPMIRIQRRRTPGRGLS